MNLPDITGRNSFSLKALIVFHDSLYFQQLSVKLIHEPWCNILNFRLADNGIDIVVDQSFFAVVGGKRPCIYAIQVHKVIQ